MRRILALTLLLALFCGCAASVKPADDERVSFYYRRLDEQTDESFESETGALAQESTTFGVDADPEKILERYLAGPEADGLTTIFPEGTSCLGTKLQSGVLILDMNEAYGALTGFERTLAAAGLTMTLTQLNGITAVQIRTSSSALLGQGSTQWTREGFVLQDTSWLYPERTVQLYFVGQNGNLQAEKRAVSYENPEQLPENALQALLDGPEEASLHTAIPAGTQILEARLTEKRCTVVLSEQFAACDTDQTSAELAVHSIAATLCDLTEVEQVQLRLADGETLRYCSIAEPLIPDSSWYN